MKTTMLVAAALLLVGGCGGEDDGGAITAPTGGQSSTTATTATTVGEEAVETEDGEHVVFLTGIDVGARTLTFDVVQFLTGEEAIAAYHEDVPDDPEGPPNDFYIVNDNPRLRTAPVSDEVDVQLVRLQEDSDAGLSAGSFEELPTYLEAYADTENDRLSFNPFRLTVVDGTITAIVEQYLP